MKDSKMTFYMRSVGMTISVTRLLDNSVLSDVKVVCIRFITFQ